MYNEITLKKKIVFCVTLSPIWVNAFQYWVIFHKKKNNFEKKKTEWANDMKFCTQIIGIDLHQMKDESWKIISSPVMSQKIWVEAL
jgi:hypothetical protein